MMDVGITAIGTASPLYKQSQEKIAEIITAILNLSPAKKRILKSIYKATGIEYRYSILRDYAKTLGQFEFFPNNIEENFPSTAVRMQLYKLHAIELVLQAIHNCLEPLKDFNKQSITHLIVISCTGMYAPGIDIEIIQRLNLNTTIKRTAINFMGCYGAFNGMKVADAICRAEPKANVLMVCVELCTLHIQQNNNMDNIVSSSIFADGAAAILIQAQPKKKKYLNIETFHCDLLPQTTQEMGWAIADHGFDMVLSSYVPKLIEVGISEFTNKLMKSYGVTRSEIDYFAIHPGGIKILQACEKSLNLSVEDNRFSYQVLKEFGNMSSATIIFVLQKIWDTVNATDHAKSIFSCAFGPGLTLESMLLKINYV